MAGATNGFMMDERKEENKRRGNPQAFQSLEMD
jgi:hypothetical protein